MIFQYQKQSEIRNRYALLIGVRDYVDQTYRTVKQTVHDTVLLKKVLKAHGYTVRLLHSGKHDALSKPTRANILADLKNIAGKTGTNDLFLVYFSGYYDLNHWDNSFLVPCDGRKSSLEKTAFSIVEFKRIIDNADARVKVFFLNAFRSGVIRDAQGLSARSGFQDFPEAAGTAILTSCRYNGIGYNWSDKHSLFAHFLSEGLKGEAAPDGKRRITLSDLKNYVCYNVKSWTDERGLSQHPTYHAALEDDPVLVKWKATEKHSPNTLSKILKGVAATVVSFIVSFLIFYIYNRSHVNALTSEAQSILPYDNMKALRLAEKAYNSSWFGIPPRLNKVLGNAGASTLERPLYGFNINHGHPINDAAFSPSGNHIVTASSDNTARLWDCRGKLLKTFHHDNIVYAASFSSQGDNILTVAEERNARLWNIDNASKPVAILEHQQKITSAIFSPDGGLILTASEDHTSALWDLQGHHKVTFLGHKDFVTSALFSPDGRFVLTASYDNTAKLWHLDGALVTTFHKHKDRVTIVLFSFDGKRILTATRLDSPVLWDTAGVRKAAFQFEKVASTALFTPNNQNVLIAYTDGTVMLWDRQGNPIKTYGKHNGTITHAQFFDDGKLLTSSTDKSARIWNSDGSLCAILSAHQRTVSVARFSPANHLLITASYDGNARLWDLKRQLALNIRSSNAGISFAAFSPDGKRIIMVPKDCNTLCTDFQSNIETTPKDRNKSNHSDIKSPDGTLILRTYADNKIKLLDKEKNVLTDFDKYQKNIHSALFSPDGMRIITTSADGTLQQWHTPQGVIQWLKTSSTPSLNQLENPPEVLGWSHFINFH